MFCKDFFGCMISVVYYIGVASAKQCFQIVYELYCGFLGLPKGQTCCFMATEKVPRSMFGKGTNVLPHGNRKGSRFLLGKGTNV